MLIMYFIATSDVIDINTKYIDLLIVGFLIPSKLISSHVISCFAMLDAVKQSLLTSETLNIKKIKRKYFI